MKTTRKAKSTRKAKQDRAEAEHVFQRLLHAAWLMDDGGADPYGEIVSDDAIYEAFINAALQFARLKIAEAGQFPPISPDRP